MTFSQAMAETEIRVACQAIGLDATATGKVIAGYRVGTGQDRPRKAHELLRKSHGRRTARLLDEGSVIQAASPPRKGKALVERVMTFGRMMVRKFARLWD